MRFQLLFKKPEDSFISRLDRTPGPHGWSAQYRVGEGSRQHISTTSGEDLETPATEWACQRSLVVTAGKPFSHRGRVATEQ